MSDHPRHPLGTNTKILLTSIFGPYTQDDEYGSRLINPMELYQNQVTRVQGVFSLRMFHRSWGLMMIQDNINSPCTLLDFPTLGRFIEEIKHNQYDVVGISSIFVNIGKVKKMCELVRKYLPNATIVVGGHIAPLSDLHEIIDADFIVKGEGIGWFRKFLGQDENAPIKHPVTYAGFYHRSMGIPIHTKPSDNTAVLIPSVGCPLGCNFCCTSSFFGGKGKFFNFYETGDELFSVMCQLEERLKIRGFFIQDENFLLNRKRALRLLELMEENNKSWSLYTFSSFNAIKPYSIEQLLGLGISYLWIGLEGLDSHYNKLTEIDTRSFVRDLQSHGIIVLGSTIIGLENHTPENIDQVIQYAVSHDTDFHQFSLYSPLPETPLYDQLKKEGVLLSEEEFPIPDWHGEYRFSYRHPHIPKGQEEYFLLRAFQKDFEINGPSLLRSFRTMLKGWKRYKNHPNKRIRNRITFKARYFKTIYGGIFWATKKWFEDKGDRRMVGKINETLQDVKNEFGLKAKISAPLIGRYIYSNMKKEEKRLASGCTYEPPTFYEKNERALILEGWAKYKPTCVRGVVP